MNYWLETFTSSFICYACIKGFSESYLQWVAKQNITVILILLLLVVNGFIHNVLLKDVGITVVTGVVVGPTVVTAGVVGPGWNSKYMRLHLHITLHCIYKKAITIE